MDARRFQAAAGETIHAYLRRSTRAWHEQVDRAFSAFDLARRDDLAAFLLRQAAALLPLERSVEVCGAAAMLPDWCARRRGAALAADLTGLGLAPPAATPVPALPSRLHGAGALYVLEGSKLGARVLLRTALASPDPEVRAATRFLGHREPGGWAGFLAVLNALPDDRETLACLAAGAQTAFALFSPSPDLADDAEPPSRVPRLSIGPRRETARQGGGHAA